MKLKFIILLSLVITLPFDVKAQFKVIRALSSIDLIMGPEMYTTSNNGDYGYENKIKLGHVIGLHFNYEKPTKKWSINIKLMYEKKRNVMENEIFYYIDSITQQLKLGNEVIETNMWAITLPLLLQYRLKEGPINLYTESGVFGSMIKQIEFEFNSPHQGVFLNTRNNINEFDWGISAGLKADYAMTNKLKIVTGITCNIGLVNLVDNGSSNTIGLIWYVGARLIDFKRRR